MKIMSPEGIHPAWVEAFNSGDVEALLRLYEPDAKLVPEPGQVVSGMEAIGAALGQFMAVGKATAEIRYCVESGGVALASASWRIAGTGPDGKPVEIAGVSADLFRRQSDGSWRLAVDHPFGGS